MFFQKMDIDTFECADVSRENGGRKMAGSFQDYLPAFKALADETRLEILSMIVDGELCACEILESFQMSQSTLSYHMKLLTDSKLVHVRRDGKKMLYTLNAEQFFVLSDLCQELSSDAEKLLAGKQEGESHG